MKEEEQEAMNVLGQHLCVYYGSIDCVNGTCSNGECNAKEFVEIAVKDCGYRSARDVEAETKYKVAKEIYLLAFQFISTAANPEPMFHKFMKEFEKKYGLYDLFGGK